MRWIALSTFGVIGLGVLVAGLAWTLKRYSLARGAARAQGKVVDNRRTLSTDSGEGRRRFETTSETFHPVVEFATPAGEIVRFIGSTGGAGAPEYQVGERVEVLYDPRNPRRAQMAAFSQLWLGPVVVSAAGLIFLLMGVGVFLLAGRGP